MTLSEANVHVGASRQARRGDARGKARRARRLELFREKIERLRRLALKMRTLVSGRLGGGN